MTQTEGPKGLSPEERLAQLEEAYKKLQSDTDRGVQNLLSKQKEQEAKLQYTEEAKKVTKDNTYLIELQKSNPNLADKICQEEYGISLEDALSKLWVEQKNEIDYDAIVEEKLQKKAVDKAIKEFQSKLSLEGEELEKFKTEFAELTEGKKLNENNVSKFLKIAYKEAIPADQIKEIEARQMALTWGTAQKSKQNSRHIEASRNFLKERGIM